MNMPGQFTDVPLLYKYILPQSVCEMLFVCLSVQGLHAVCTTVSAQEVTVHHVCLRGHCATPRCGVHHWCTRVTMYMPKNGKHGPDNSCSNQRYLSEVLCNAAPKWSEELWIAFNSPLPMAIYGQMIVTEAVCWGGRWLRHCDWYLWNKYDYYQSKASVCRSIIRWLLPFFNINQSVLDSKLQLLNQLITCYQSYQLKWKIHVI